MQTIGQVGGQAANLGRCGDDIAISGVSTVPRGHALQRSRAILAKLKADCPLLSCLRF
jgi:hypothetical protein